MRKQINFSTEPQNKGFGLGSGAIADTKGYYPPGERTLNWLGVFLIVLFSILSFGAYLIACAIRGSWLLPQYGFDSGARVGAIDGTAVGRLSPDDVEMEQLIQGDQPRTADNLWTQAESFLMKQETPAAGLDSTFSSRAGS